jgi:hypothetical protein
MTRGIWRAPGIYWLSVVTLLNLVPLALWLFGAAAQPWAWWTCVTLVVLALLWPLRRGRRVMEYPPVDTILGVGTHRHWAWQAARALLGIVGMAVVAVLLALPPSVTLPGLRQKTSAETVRLAAFGAHPAAPREKKAIGPLRAVEERLSELCSLIERSMYGRGPLLNAALAGAPQPAHVSLLREAIADQVARTGLAMTLVPLSPPEDVLVIEYRDEEHRDADIGVIKALCGRIKDLAESMDLILREAWQDWVIMAVAYGDSLRAPDPKRDWKRGRLLPTVLTPIEFLALLSVFPPPSASSIAEDHDQCIEVRALRRFLRREPALLAPFDDWLHASFKPFVRDRLRARFANSGVSLADARELIKGLGVGRHPALAAFKQTALHMLEDVLPGPFLEVSGYDSGPWRPSWDAEEVFHEAAQSIALPSMGQTMPSFLTYVGGNGEELSDSRDGQAMPLYEYAHGRVIAVLTSHGYLFQPNGRTPTRTEAVDRAKALWTQCYDQWLKQLVWRCKDTAQRVVEAHKTREGFTSMLEKEPMLGSSYLLQYVATNQVGLLKRRNSALYNTARDRPDMLNDGLMLRSFAGSGSWPNQEQAQAASDWRKADLLLLAQRAGQVASHLHSTADPTAAKARGEGLQRDAIAAGLVWHLLAATPDAPGGSGSGPAGSDAPFPQTPPEMSNSQYRDNVLNGKDKVSEEVVKQIIAQYPNPKDQERFLRDLILENRLDERVADKYLRKPETDTGGGRAR